MDFKKPFNAEQGWTYLGDSKPEYSVPVRTPRAVPPRDPYNRHTATAKASELHPGAFAKVASESPARDRYQILLEHGKETYLVASGPSWVDALETWYLCHEEVKEKLSGAAPPTVGEPGNGPAAASFKEVYAEDNGRQIQAMRELDAINSKAMTALGFTLKQDKQEKADGVQAHKED